MSRCFPFPPPGYERKIKADDTDLLKKEKHKEKKHKKEKKDKEKKERKEKREKERCDEKLKEKKDKKEKHRDKKKDKEKDRNKDGHKSDSLFSEEKKVVGSADNHVHKLAEKSKERKTDRDPTSTETRIDGASGVHNGILLSNNNHHVHEIKSSKYMSDLCRKSVDDEWRIPNPSSYKNVGAERKKNGVVLLAAKGRGPLLDAIERTKEKPALDWRPDGRGVVGDAKFTRNALVPNTVGLVPNPVGVVQTRVAGNRPLEKKIEQKVDGKEKVREEGGEDRKEEKRKEKAREKPFLKDKDREKEKKEEVTKVTSEEKHIQLTRTKDGGENMPKSTLKDSNKRDIPGVLSAGFYNTTKDSNNRAANVNNNLRKRKDPGLNGVYDELVTGPNKMARASASPHSSTGNGRSVEPCQNSSAVAPSSQRLHVNVKLEPKLHVASSTQKPPMKIKVDGKECKINGIVPEPFTQPSRDTVPKAEPKGSDAPAKPPHPDTKYLSHVLSVPKMDDWSDFDDQDWLFNSNNSLTRKTEGNSSLIDGTHTPQVWARGLWVETLDVYALPYVIPH